MNSNMRDRPDPFGPPNGSGIAAVFGSVVGVPSSAIAQPSGMGSPAARAWTSRPSAATLVAMSRTTGPRPVGTPIASGLVETLRTRAP